MQQINATSTGSYAVQRGKKGVRVGIIDTGDGPAIFIIMIAGAFCLWGWN